MADPHSGKKARRQIPAETKLQILKEARSTNLSTLALAGGARVSQVCEQYGTSPTLFYQREAINLQRISLSPGSGRPQTKTERDAKPCLAKPTH
jgi:transposase-like protein